MSTTRSTSTPNLEKELARKLAWAVISTLAPSEHHRRRTRVWAWRVACKMVAIKSTLHIDKQLPPPDNGLAGGGVAGVTRRDAHLFGAPVTRPLGGGDASTTSEGPDDVRSRSDCPESGGVRAEATCPHSGCSRRSGARCVRRPAGSDYRWRWFPPAEASSESSDGRRHEDSPHDSECHLEKSG